MRRIDPAGPSPAMIPGVVPGVVLAVLAVLAVPMAGHGQEATGTVVAPDHVVDSAATLEGGTGDGWFARLGEAVPEVVLTPRAALLRDTLVAGGEAMAPLYHYYRMHDFAPVWDDGRRAALAAAMRAAADHGLPAGRYDPAALVAAADAGDAAAVAAEIAASQALLAWGRDITSGVLEPRAVDRELVIAPHRPSVASLLEGMAGASDPAAWLAGLEPQNPHYRTLLAEKARLEALVAAGGWGETVPDGPTLRPGDAGGRVLALRGRLERIGGAAIPPDDPAAPERLDEGLVTALMSFQEKHGLNPDGVAGPATLAAVNRQADDRLRQVLVNLERQRWMNFERGQRHIYVNLADFTMAVYEDGAPIFTSRAIIGKPGKTRTPEFYEEMTHLVVNPTWHVPRSIATEEYLPRLQQNPGALPHLQVMTRNGTRINPALVDFRQFTKGNFPFVIKQAPGGGNALGRVKFMFPNEFDIYLHDTPTKPLFERDVRAFSHGCVRLQRPFELAHLLLGWQADNPEALFQSYLDRGREQHLDLAQAIPIYITYQTAWVDADGVPQYREDIYGRDGRIFEALSDVGVVAGDAEG